MSKGLKYIENHLDDSTPKWFAVYTRFKGEKMAFRHLAKKGISVYLPLQKLTRRYTRKVKVVELPLISCYIFVKITKQEYVKVLETESVVDFVRFSNNLISIPEEEIETMKRVLGENWEVQIEQSKFEPGDLVEISAGNLIGLKGRLVDQRDKQQVLVDLERLGYTLRISVDKQLLRKVDTIFA